MLLQQEREREKGGNYLLTNKWCSIAPEKQIGGVKKWKSETKQKRAFEVAARNHWAKKKWCALIWYVWSYYLNTLLMLIMCVCVSRLSVR